MNTVYFLVQQTMFFSIPLLIVALGGMFSERSGVVNIALEGIMIMGAFSSILFINIVQSSGAALPPQLLLLLAVLIAAAVGVLVSMAHAYASINMKADQVISGTAINMFAPAFAIFAARMIRSVQQIPFSNTFRITKVPVLGDIPVLGPLLFQNPYITTYLGFAVLAVLGAGAMGALAVLGFLVCYLAGCALSILSAGRTNLIDLLSEKE